MAAVEKEVKLFIEELEENLEAMYLSVNNLQMHTFPILWQLCENQLIHHSPYESLLLVRKGRLQFVLLCKW